MIRCDVKSCLFANILLKLKIESALLGADSFDCWS